MTRDAPQSLSGDWGLRPWLLAGMLGIAGLLVHFATDGADEAPWRMALAAFAAFGAVAAALTLERERIVPATLFGALIGAVMAGIAWRVAHAGDRYADAPFWFAASVLSALLAVPLFQAGVHRLRFATPYRTLHNHAWNDAISGAGALAFTGLSWVLLLILSQLFKLVEIDLLQELMRESWFGWLFSGAAFGASLGTLRNQLKVIATLQLVVMLVFALLAVPLAAALAIFVVALVLSGGQALWNATDSATPILLACAVGAFVLANAIIRDGEEDTSRSRVQRIAALILALAILPLAVFGAISMGVRIGQHGLSPERIWGLIAVALACACGLAYWVAVARGRKAWWRERVRQSNLHLAVVTCILALVLALPLFDFGALAANNQLARLERGEVSAEDFDYAALRWDFGEAGQRALARLEKSGTPEVAERAALARKQTERTWSGARDFRTEREINVRVQPDDPALRKLVIDHLRANPGICRDFCVALDLGTTKDGEREVAFVQDGYHVRFALPSGIHEPRVEAAPPSGQLKPQSRVEVGTVEQKYILVDGKPVGPPLD